MNRNRLSSTRRTVLVIAALGGLAGTGLLASTAGAANARGGDDTSVEVRGRVGDPAGHAKNGADDPAGHVRGGKGADDPIGHAKNGADDPAGHVRGGKGADDPANHG